eukprot:CAMPEP_0170527434 /NCGR_PEP_ID=MMETSP0209-20121228/12895_1 /TAXON_ID=665100 ORGANISM="Litonotus pictus, Strain P1" /NCGR_SAMPLE_ID=MMETSP0209 /ASSEMBLY_ACC=CAM_ASM_000301 /LENGTH=196 /DNA_ID=CAMNT_0010817943 /DNA_START=274 /DNA_END=861 /DNA_ORIENTATION=+
MILDEYEAERSSSNHSSASSMLFMDKEKFHQSISNNGNNAKNGGLNSISNTINREGLREINTNGNTRNNNDYGNSPVNGNGSSSSYRDNEKNSGSSFGSLITVISFNLVALNILASVLLLAIRINDSDSIKMDFVTIPILLSMGIAFLFFIYILPALIQRRLLGDIILYISCFVSLLIFIFFLIAKAGTEQESGTW